MGLSLPTEAQWEYAARGGRSSVWWTGDEKESLIGAANLSDRFAQASYGSIWAIDEWLDDGNLVHAPVNAYLANPFGLHNVHGNVWEWCLDGYDAGFYGQTSDKDPVNEPSRSALRVHRGGSFMYPAAHARLANRRSVPPEHAGNGLGLRPARTMRTP